jgi:serine/threonine-protein kinase
MQTASLIRFGPYQVDGRAGELRKSGARIPLQEQSLQILVMLLEKPGEVVLREDIQRRLWPNDTIVGYDHSINSAVRRLRAALNESASEPRYIETVGKRGYRFIGSLEPSSIIEPLEPSPVPMVTRSVTDNIESLEASPEETPGSPSIGSLLGPYCIEDRIGAGGMGEVWKARDTRVDRYVAIKTSHEEFNDRFRRDARAIAALNHPNICTLFDVGPNYLVMELIDGPTLADRIQEEAIPLDEALAVANQIANALDAAHEKAIVHLDLKPANIKIRSDGSVKILDFGLAKAGAEVQVTQATPGSPAALFEAGVILGTASYMSPEQAAGRPVDRRADIYAFGVVLYEMLTGERLHRGETVTETLASVMRDEPGWEKVPAPVRRLLQSCLEKDPRNRLRHIGDVMRLVDDDPRPQAAMAGGQGWAWNKAWAGSAAWLWLGISALALAAVTGFAWWRPARLSDLPMVRVDVDLGAELDVSAPASFASNVAISPDGTRIVFVARALPGGRPKLFTRRLDQAKAVEIAGTDRAAGPFFSPDGRQIGFVSSGKLYRISVDGGQAVPLMDIPGTFVGASWSEDRIVVAQRNLPLAIISAGGGPATPVTEMPPLEYIQFSPQFLPGGKAVLFSANSINKDTVPQLNSIEVVTLKDRRRKILLHDGSSHPRYLASFGGSGHLVYTLKGVLYAIPFDPEKLETGGPAVRVLDEMGTGSGGAFIPQPFDISRTGTLVYLKNRQGRTALSTIQWLDSTGKMSPLLAKPGPYKRPRISPDGKRLVIAVQEAGPSDIQVYDWQSDRSARVTFGGRVHTDPAWTPDGRYVVFDAGVNMFWSRADGAGQPQLLVIGRATIPVPWSFSPDGKRLAYVAQGSGSQIWTVAIEESGGRLKAGTPEPFLTSASTDTAPAFSPDGKWIAYQSNESGQRDDIYVRPFPASASAQGGKWVISTNGGSDPHWSRAGHELLYKGPEGMMSAAYSVKDGMFVAEKPRVWRAGFSGTDFDLAPDGQRLAVLLQMETVQPEHEAVFIENFFDELRRRVPASHGVKQ